MNKTIIKSHPRPEIGRAVFAAVDIQGGEVVIETQRLKTLSERTKYSMELNGKHILVDEPGVLVNHSCSPNCEVIENKNDAYDFVAVRNITKGEEITFDYETIESEISAFKTCLCGAEKCRKTMSGGSSAIQSS